jgi:hypothetical protein
MDGWLRTLHIGAEDPMLMQARRSVLGLLLCFGAAGCYGYSRRPIPTPDLARHALSGSIRVTLNDGKQYDLREAYTLADTLVGIARQASGQRVALHFGRIAKVESRRFSGGRSIGLGLVLFLALGVLQAVLGGSVLSFR